MVRNQASMCFFFHLLLPRPKAAIISVVGQLEGVGLVRSSIADIQDGGSGVGERTPLGRLCGAGVGWVKSIYSFEAKLDITRGKGQ